MRAALVLHGEAPSREDLALLDHCDLVVAADGAALALFAANVDPDLIVGDMDSLGEAGVREAEERGIPLERHPPRKDRTDGELALEAVLARKPAEVLILGGHGGRSAQFLATLGLLRRCHDLGLPARMVGRGEEVRYLGKGQRWDLGTQMGATVNVLAADAPGARVEERGLAWSGTIALSPRSALGVSNRVVAADARIDVLEGVVLVVLERRPQ